MWIVIIIAVIGLIIGMIIVETQETNKFEQQNKIEISRPLVRYMGGLPDIAGSKDIYLGVSSSKVILKFIDEIKEIDMKDIIKAEIQSATQINESLSLGKIAIFGILGLGMKKQTEDVKNYLLLSYKDNEDSRNLVFDINSKRELEEITKTIRKYAFN